MDTRDRCDRHCEDGLEKIFRSVYIWQGTLLNEVWILVSNGEPDSNEQQSLEFLLFDTSPELIEKKAGFELQKS